MLFLSYAKFPVHFDYFNYCNFIIFFTAWQYYSSSFLEDSFKTELK